MCKVVSDHYRCPPQFIGTSLTADSCLPDLPDDALTRWPGFQLHFEVDQLVDHLRHERYTTSLHGIFPRAASNPLLSKLYYSVRPFLPVSLRRLLQRMYLRGWERITFPAWPVDLTVERWLETALLFSMKDRGIDTVPFIWFWPDGASGAAILTHDVETEQGRDFCPRLMDIDESFGLRASFQIVPEQRYPVTTAFLEEIRERGHEINVHDLNHDGNLFRDRREFLSRVKAINGYGRLWGAKGFRSGVLYRNLDWYDALEFEYDMTVPNVGYLDPQGGGCCTAFPYFIGGILELPLTTTQDYSVFHILREQRIDLWKTQANLVMEKHGLLSFLTHPDYLLESGAQSKYRDLLAFLVELKSERDLWIGLPNHVNEWWRQRSKMILVPDGKGWRIEGTGNERARVAYAHIDGNKLTYSRESFVPAAS